MFHHSGKATIDSEGIKRAIELYAKDKGMPFDIAVTKFFYRKGTLKFHYDVKPQEEWTVMACTCCTNRRPCKLTEGGSPICAECEART